MKPTDFASAELARTAPETLQRMISNSTMRIYLKGTQMLLVVYEIAEGKWDTLDEAGPENPVTVVHPAKEICLLVVKSLEGGSTDDNDFNFMRDNSIGDANIAEIENLRDNLLPTHGPYIDALLNICLAHCNVTHYPLAGLTDEEYDLAVAEEALKENPMLVTATTGIRDVDGKDYILNKGQREPHRLTLTITEPLAYDDVFIITAASKANDDLAYSLDPRPRGTINVPAGATVVTIDGIDYNPSTKPNSSGLDSKVRYFVASQYQRDFTASVAKVVK